MVEQVVSKIQLTMEVLEVLVVVAEMVELLDFHQ
jgi:hypothetical protein